MRTEALFAGLVVAFLAAVAVPSASAATLEPIGSFTNPMFVTSEPADPDELLVVERRGVVTRWSDGAKSPYLDISDMVSTDGEGGMASIALSPDYATSGQLYVFYTDLMGDLRIDEFTASGESVSPATRREVLTIEHPNSDFHNGGQLQFGPDGFLYISTGDAVINDAAQDIGSLLGKLLRIWPHPAADPSIGFTTPSDNPYKGVPGSDEIWSLGLRNPFRFSFDRLTGDLVIGDVGETEWEEIDFVRAADGGGRAANFGWRTCEGAFAFGTSDPCELGVLPAYAYPHSASGCGGSIIGGYVVRDPSVEDLYGRYVFTDFCNGKISSVLLAAGGATDVRDEGLTIGHPSSFGEDSCGRIYLASLDADTVYRFVGDDPATCSPTDPGPTDPGPTDPGPTDPGPTGPGPPGDGPSDQAPSECRGELVTRAAAPEGGRLVGTAGKDVIAGSAADDVIVGRGGGDVICGLAGDDTLRGGGGGDELRGGAGDDELRGGGGADGCSGGPGRDVKLSC